MLINHNHGSHIILSGPPVLSSSLVPLSAGLGFAVLAGVDLVAQSLQLVTLPAAAQCPRQVLLLGHTKLAEREG